MEFSLLHLIVYYSIYSNIQINNYVFFTCFFHFFFRANVLRNISDVINYQRKHKVNTEKWPLILYFWREACVLYSECIASSKMDQLLQLQEGHFNPYEYTINFDTILRACDDIENKRTAAHCKLQYIDGQISLNMFLSFIFQVQFRLASGN